ncbi:GldM family protein [Tellurirhabdus rosea]|uniref:GldM family protein n=1 Tax=Tellurirhabdus rosea TaxID=2674997 RepID=UPI002254A33A|nr:GldM family protein [Tellurirhabdus rosea]
MKRFILPALLHVGLLLPVLAQQPAPAPAAEALPQPKITVFVNNRPWQNEKSFPEGYIKQIAFRAVLDSASLQTFSHLERDLLVRKATISIAKGNRRVASMVWQPGASILSLASEARSGDRFVIEVSEVAARDKAGATRRLPATQVFSIPVN